jgi:hypothetical protein
MIILLCVLLTVVLLFFIFFPEDEFSAGEEKTRLAYLYERKEVVYENLRDLNFEYRGGKFPDVDFQAMRSTLETEAAQVLAEIEHLEKAAAASALAAKSRKGVRS